MNIAYPNIQIIVVIRKYLYLSNKIPITFRKLYLQHKNRTYLRPTQNIFKNINLYLKCLPHRTLLKYQLYFIIEGKVLFFLVCFHFLAKLGLIHLGRTCLKVAMFVSIMHFVSDIRKFFFLYP